MKKLLLVFMLVLLALSLVACGGDEQPDTPASGYKDPEHKTGTYRVDYVLKSKTVTHFYEAGEMPDPPTVADEKVGCDLFVFAKWDNALTQVTKNTVYTAKYDRTTFEYTATFVLGGGRTAKVKATAGTVAKAPATPDYRGMEFACWDVEPYAAIEDVTYTAIYTDVISGASMKKAWAEPIWVTDGIYRDLMATLSIYPLFLQEYKNPQPDGLLAERAAAHLSSYFSHGGLLMDCSVNWNYGVTIALLVLAKNTPSIWERLSYSDRARLDFTVEALTYLTSFGTSQHNDYRTGPSLKGNYRKNWGPNYRFGSAGPIPFLVYYLGDGNVERGAEKFNDLIHAFDEATYDRVIRTFQSYGWKEAYTAWTAEGIVAGDGSTSDTKAKDILLNGGVAYHLNYSGSEMMVTQGVGVNNLGEDYIYVGYDGSEYPLTDISGLMRNLIDYNFSGGKVVNEWWYNGERVAWIIDGTTTPYLGMEGMSIEIGNNNRSSTVYAHHNFVMSTFFISVCREIPLLDENGSPLTDAFGESVVIYDVTEDEEVWSRVQVGNEDFIYKFIHGYQCYAEGSYGVNTDIYAESDAGRGYFMMKDFWRNQLLPFGTIDPAE